MLAPHHGSKTSSTQAFLNAVSPSLIVVSSGFNNRFKHPAKTIIKRASLFEKLSTVLKQNQGKCPVRLHYQVKQSRGFALLDAAYLVTPNQQLIDRRY
jgi:beta-lactamase superfamily II metal-dependent hydrolase